MNSPLETMPLGIAKECLLKHLVKHLLNVAVNGAATAILATPIASGMGVPMNFKQLGVAALSGAVIATIRHLQQSPLIQENQK